MAPWTTFTELFERFTHPGAHAGNLREEELRLAAAALLVHATAIDGEVAPEERRKLRALLQTHFGLGDDETRRLIREAEVREHDAVDLYRFTSVLCSQLDQDGRKRIIEMLWEIAMADRVVHEFEFEPRLAGGRAAWGLGPRSRAVAGAGVDCSSAGKKKPRSWCDRGNFFKNASYRGLRFSSRPPRTKRLIALASYPVVTEGTHLHRKQGRIGADRGL